MDIETWLADTLPKHVRLTDATCTTIKSLLEENKIEYLAISGRTKNENSIREKIRRKNYFNPETQLTDISGVRIILYIESDVETVFKILSDAFQVEKKNSSNRDEILSANEVGYRSVHLVAELGKKRIILPEFTGFKNLKFEIQIRTVLQHAWAELSHDRSYKFQGSLPEKIQRKLYLHAGLLEIADKGFSEISKEIDEYKQNIDFAYQKEDLSAFVNSISLRQFVIKWSNENNFEIRNTDSELSSLVLELKEFGIHTIEELDEIIPDRYAEVAKENEYNPTLFGLVRSWMIINNCGKTFELTSKDWEFTVYEDKNEEKLKVFESLMSEKDFNMLKMNTHFTSSKEDQ